MSATHVIVGASLAGAKAAAVQGLPDGQGRTRDDLRPPAGVVRGGRTVDASRIADPGIALDEFA